MGKHEGGSPPPVGVDGVIGVDSDSGGGGSVDAWGCGGLVCVTRQRELHIDRDRALDGAQLPRASASQRGGDPTLDDVAGLFGAEVSGRPDRQGVLDHCDRDGRRQFVNFVNESLVTGHERELSCAVLGGDGGVHGEFADGGVVEAERR